MHIHLIFLCGAVVASAAFFALLYIAQRYPSWAFPALMLFLIGTQPLGYLIWGEPLASTYYWGWLAGLTPCLAYRFWLKVKSATANLLSEIFVARAALPVRSERLFLLFYPHLFIHIVVKSGF